ncbi:MAG: InlB B-repeat-containing protein [Lachnospiraceae bacterium]|nr:InlB B-repeat-containing protein [Lachnospiraceae bacterium]
MFLKRIAALLIAFTVSMGMITVSEAAGEKMSVSVSSEKGLPGSTVEVKIQLADNPGVAGMTFDVEFPDNLILLNASWGTEIAAHGNTVMSNRLESPFTMMWVGGTQSFGNDGLFATLTFKIRENADENTFSAVNIVYDEDNVYDIEDKNVPCTIVNGGVSILSCVPGDINGDEKVNSKDVSRLMQYLAHWDVTVNEPTLDVNGDEKINSKDVSRLMQYLAHWDVKIYPDLNPSVECIHSMSVIDAVPSTCTENGIIAHYHCNKCGKNYSDANGINEILNDDIVIASTGHIIAIDEYVAPTYENSGLTEGSHCSVCGEVLLAQEVIPRLVSDEYAIAYSVAGDYDYLRTIEIDNPNPVAYTSQQSVILKDLSVEGFSFLGWYNSDGVKVTEISKGSSGNVILYAKWNVKQYTITFDSPLSPVPDKTYTTDKDTAIDNPTLANYTFAGWSNDDAEIVTIIPKGTTGNITLHANWTSKRNQTRPVSKLSDPYVFEDSENGQILFVYELGTVENIPLFTTAELISAQGVRVVTSETKTDQISNTTASNIVNAISNATTKTSAWSLGKDWNDTTTFDKSYLKQTGVSETEASSVQKTSSNTYTLNSSQGGSYTVDNSSGISSKVGGSRSQEKEDIVEKGQNFKLGVDTKYSNTLETEAHAGGSIGPISLGGSVKDTSTFEIGLNSEYENHINTTDKSKTGSTISNELAQNATNSVTNSKSWNSSQGYSSSSSVSLNDTVSKAVSSVIAEQKNYGSSYAVGGSNSESEEKSQSETNSRQYSDTLSYSKSNISTVTQSFETTGEVEGYYRVVCAGIAHVFGVVGYDVANSAYYTYSYSVMDERTYQFLDYSRTTPSFDDNENGVLPFEIPSFVNDYVNTRIVRSNGLTIDIDTGYVTDYSGEDSTVIIPSYIADDNGDGTFSLIKVRGITSSAFAGSDIEAIRLGGYISEIPDGAFAGCENLKAIEMPGVTVIGDNAFSGCISLDGFNITTDVASIGVNAFKGVKSISVKAANSNVAEASAASGAEDIIINIAGIKTSGMRFFTNGTDRFEVQGENGTFSDLAIDSDAYTVVLNGINFIDCSITPIKLNSENVNLNRVTVNANGYGMMLLSDTTNIALRGAVSIASSRENAIVCRNIKLSQLNSGVAGNMTAVGNILICGSVVGSKYLNGTLVTISEDEYQNYIKGLFTVSFDSNGGSTAIASQKVIYGQTYGSLPEAERENYKFDGWFTRKDGGERITPETVFTESTDVTVYAHWILNTFNVIFDANGGISAETSRIVAYGSTFGSLPSAQKDYYTFDGWFTEQTGGTKITESTVFESSDDITLYAHWTINPISGWVKVSEIPNGAETIERKYTYTQKTFLDSKNASESGWTLSGSEWKESERTSFNYASFPGGFDTSNTYYQNFHKSKDVSAFENSTSKRTIISDSWAGYIYWHWMYDTGANGTDTRAIYHQYGYGPDNGFLYKYFFAFASTRGDYNSDVYYCNSQGITNYIVYDQHTSNAECGGATRWFRFDYRVCTYADYYKLFHYYKETVQESASQPIGSSTVYDIQEWVRYRAK